IRDGHVTGVQTCALPIFSFRLAVERTGKLSSSSVTVFLFSTKDWRQTFRRASSRDIGHSPQPSPACSLVTERGFLSSPRPTNFECLRWSVRVQVSQLFFSRARKRQLRVLRLLLQRARKSLTHSRAP